MQAGALVSSSNTAEPYTIEHALAPTPTGWVTVTTSKSFESKTGRDVVPTAGTSLAPSAVAAAASRESNPSTSTTLKPAQIGGIFTGCFVFVILVVLPWCCACYRRTGPNSTRPKSPRSDTSSSARSTRPYVPPPLPSPSQDYDGPSAPRSILRDARIFSINERTPEDLPPAGLTVYGNDRSFPVAEPSQHGTRRSHSQRSVSRTRGAPSVNRGDLSVPVENGADAAAVETSNLPQVHPAEPGARRAATNNSQSPSNIGPDGRQSSGRAASRRASLAPAGGPAAPENPQRSTTLHNSTRSVTNNVHPQSDARPHTTQTGGRREAERPTTAQPLALPAQPIASASRNGEMATTSNARMPSYVKAQTTQNGGRLGAERPRSAQPLQHVAVDSVRLSEAQRAQQAQRSTGRAATSNAPLPSNIGRHRSQHSTAGAATQAESQPSIQGGRSQSAPLPMNQYPSHSIARSVTGNATRSSNVRIMGGQQNGAAATHAVAPAGTGPALPANSGIRRHVMFEGPQIVDAPVEGRSRASAAASRRSNHSTVAEKGNAVESETEDGNSGEDDDEGADTDADGSRDMTDAEIATDNEGVNGSERANEGDDVTESENIEQTGNNGNGDGETTSAGGGEEVQAGKEREGEDEGEGGIQGPLPAPPDASAPESENSAAETVYHTARQPTVEPVLEVREPQIVREPVVVVETVMVETRESSTRVRHNPGIGRGELLIRTRGRPPPPAGLKQNIPVADYKPSRWWRRLILP